MSLWLIGPAVLGGVIRADTLKDSPPAATLRVDRPHAVEGWRTGFFHPVSGERLARLSIGRVAVEYEKRGFLRVAWAPQLVLTQVQLEAETAEAWSVLGAEIRSALVDFKPGVPLRIQGLMMRLPSGEFRAVSATWAGPDRLRLEGIENEAGPWADRGFLWLQGPLAGHMTRDQIQLVGSSQAPEIAPIARAETSAPEIP